MLSEISRSDANGYRLGEESNTQLPEESPNNTNSVAQKYILNSMTISRYKHNATHILSALRMEQSSFILMFMN